MHEHGKSMTGAGFGLLKGALLALLIALAPVAGAGEKTASAWLEQLGPALNMTSYRGVFVYARGGRVHSMQVAHRYVDGMVEERLVLQDGGVGEIVRRGMDVVCVLPRQGKIRLDQVIPSGPFAKAFASDLMPVNKWYSSDLVGEDRIAGYDAVIIALTARDAYRYSHRLWLEKDTGLLVKRDVGEAGGPVLEHFQFTSLEITGDIPDSELEIQARGRIITRNAAGAQPGQSEAATGRMAGWKLGWRPQGFVPAAAPRSRAGQAVAFSDGVAAFSVFVEPEGPVKMPRGASRIGATTVYMRELSVAGRPFLVTVVGEVPPNTARQVADSVQVEDADVLNAGRL